MGGTLVAPVAGDYLTDGKRLVQVLGVDREGKYEAEDCGNEAIVKIAAHELTGWRAVKSA